MSVVVIMIVIAIVLGLVLARCMDWVAVADYESEDAAPISGDAPHQESH